MITRPNLANNSMANLPSNVTTPFLWMWGACLRIWGLWVGLMALFSAGRLSFWLLYMEPERIHDWRLLRGSLVAGWRDDLAVAGILSLISLLLILPLALWGRRHSFVWINRWNMVWLTLAAFLEVCELYYYSFYHARFDPTVFGLGEDNTSAILVTVWHDYPAGQVLMGVLILGLALSCGSNCLARRWDRIWSEDRARVAVLMSSLTLMAVVWLSVPMAAAVKSYANSIKNSNILVVRMPFNAVTSLASAISERFTYIMIGDDPLAGIHRFGFSSVAQAAVVAGLDPAKDIGEQLFMTSPGKEVSSHPNIVLTLLEAFGMDPLQADGPTNDMLGRLRPHFTHDYLFTNFMTGQGATHQEIENIFLGSPITPLTLDRAGQISFRNSAMWPFKKAGYRTIFVFAGSRGWRDLGRMLPQQGFDEVFDRVDIMAKYPDAKANSWGVYDEFVLRFAREKLEEEAKQGQPVFIFVVVNTNHPPYTLDTPHRSLPLSPATLGSRGNPDMDIRAKVMATYQYQADQFGGFLDAIEKSPLADKTIVVGFGDHNLHDVYHYELPENQPDVDRVVGFFRLPTSLRPANVDLARFSGHKDLMPTLIQLAIPGGQYFNTGSSLFLPQSSFDYGLSLFDRVYLPEGVTFAVGAPQFHAWKYPYRELVAATSQTPPEVARKVRQVAASVALRDWYIRSQVIANRQETLKRPAGHLAGAP